MKAEEIRNLSDEELGVELVNLQDGLFRMGVRKVTESAEGGASLKGLKKDIARVLTIKRERELKAGRSS